MNRKRKITVIISAFLGSIFILLSVFTGWKFLQKSNFIPSEIQYLTNLINKYNYQYQTLINYLKEYQFAEEKFLDEPNFVAQRDALINQIKDQIIQFKFDHLNATEFLKLDHRGILKKMNNFSIFNESVYQTIKKINDSYYQALNAKFKTMKQDISTFQHSWPSDFNFNFLNQRDQSELKTSLTLNSFDDKQVDDCANLTCLHLIQQKIIQLESFKENFVQKQRDFLVRKASAYQALLQKRFPNSLFFQFQLAKLLTRLNEWSDHPEQNNPIKFLIDTNTDLNQAKLFGHLHQLIKSFFAQLESNIASMIELVPKLSTNTNNSSFIPYQTDTLSVLSQLSSQLQVFLSQPEEIISHKFDIFFDNLQALKINLIKLIKLQTDDIKTDDIKVDDDHFLAELLKLKKLQFYSDDYYDDLTKLLVCINSVDDLVLNFFNYKTWPLLIYMGGTSIMINFIIYFLSKTPQQDLKNQDDDDFDDKEDENDDNDDFDDHDDDDDKGKSNDKPKYKKKYDNQKNPLENNEKQKPRVKWWYQIFLLDCLLWIKSKNYYYHHQKFKEQQNLLLEAYQNKIQNKVQNEVTDPDDLFYPYIQLKIKIYQLQQELKKENQPDQRFKLLSDLNSLKIKLNDELMSLINRIRLTPKQKQARKPSQVQIKEGMMLIKTPLRDHYYVIDDPLILKKIMNLQQKQDLLQVILEHAAFLGFDDLGINKVKNLIDEEISNLQNELITGKNELKNYQKVYINQQGKLIRTFEVNDLKKIQADVNCLLTILSKSKEQKDCIRTYLKNYFSQQQEVLNRLSFWFPQYNERLKILNQHPILSPEEEIFLRHLFTSEVIHILNFLALDDIDIDIIIEVLKIPQILADKRNQPSKKRVEHYKNQKMVVQLEKIVEILDEKNVGESKSRNNINELITKINDLKNFLNEDNIEPFLTHISEYESYLTISQQLFKESKLKSIKKLVSAKEILKVLEAKHEPIHLCSTSSQILKQKYQDYLDQLTKENIQDKDLNQVIEKITEIIQLIFKSVSIELNLIVFKDLNDVIIIKDDHDENINVIKKEDFLIKDLLFLLSTDIQPNDIITDRSLKPYIRRKILKFFDIDDQQLWPFEQAQIKINDDQNDDQNNNMVSAASWILTLALKQLKWKPNKKQKQVDQLLDYQAFIQLNSKFKFVQETNVQRLIKDYLRDHHQYVNYLEIAERIWNNEPKIINLHQRLIFAQVFEKDQKEINNKKDQKGINELTEDLKNLEYEQSFWLKQLRAHYQKYGFSLKQITFGDSAKQYFNYLQQIFEKEKKIENLKKKLAKPKITLKVQQNYQNQIIALIFEIVQLEKQMKKIFLDRIFQNTLLKEKNIKEKEEEKQLKQLEEEEQEELEKENDESSSVKQNKQVIIQSKSENNINVDELSKNQIELIDLILSTENYNGVEGENKENNIKYRKQLHELQSEILKSNLNMLNMVVPEVLPQGFDLDLQILSQIESSLSLESAYKIHYLINKYRTLVQQKTSSFWPCHRHRNQQAWNELSSIPSRLAFYERINNAKLISEKEVAQEGYQIIRRYLETLYYQVNMDDFLNQFHLRLIPLTENNLDYFYQNFVFRFHDAVTTTSIDNIQQLFNTIVNSNINNNGFNEIDDENNIINTSTTNINNNNNNINNEININSIIIDNNNDDSNSLEARINKILNYKLKSLTKLKKRIFWIPFIFQPPKAMSEIPIDRYQFIIGELSSSNKIEIVKKQLTEQLKAFRNAMETLQQNNIDLGDVENLEDVVVNLEQAISDWDNAESDNNQEEEEEDKKEDEKEEKEEDDDNEYDIDNESSNKETIIETVENKEDKKKKNEKENGSKIEVVEEEEEEEDADNDINNKKETKIEKEENNSTKENSKIDNKNFNVNPILENSTKLNNDTNSTELNNVTKKTKRSIRSIKKNKMHDNHLLNNDINSTNSTSNSTNSTVSFRSLRVNRAMFAAIKLDEHLFSSLLTITDK